MVERGLFDNSQARDRIALLAVFMPQIRTWIQKYVNVWNTHRIRKQSNRLTSVAGRPVMLFKHPPPNATDSRLCVDMGLVAKMRDDLIEHSKLFLKNCIVRD